MGLKVRFERANYRNQCESKFLHGWISFFGTVKHLAGVIYGLLHSFFFSDQGNADGGRGDSQLEKKLFSWL